MWHLICISNDTNEFINFCDRLFIRCWHSGAVDRLLSGIVPYLSKFLSKFFEVHSYLRDESVIFASSKELQNLRIFLVIISLPSVRISNLIHSTVLLCLCSLQWSWYVEYCYWWWEMKQPFIWRTEWRGRLSCMARKTRP